MVTKMFAGMIFLVAPTLFAQDGPRGFLGCNGYDPKGWAEEAGPGECVVSSGKVVVDHGIYVGVYNPPCASGGTNPFVDALVSGFKIGVSYGLSDYLGPAADIAGEKLGNEFQKAVEGRIDPKSNCQVVSVKLPKGATIVRAAYSSWWDGKYNQDTEDEYTGHYAIWQPHQITNTESGPVFWAVFKNWSHDTIQFAVIHVIYAPANMDRKRQRKPDSLQ